jgi:hypothetical protein
MNIFEKKKPHSKRKDRRSSKVVFKAEVSHNMHVINVDILDISRTGLKFASEKKIQQGSRIGISFLVKDTDKAADLEVRLSLNAKVINEYGIDSKGRFVYGVKFNRIFSWYDMRRIEKLVWIAELGPM